MSKKSTLQTKPVIIKKVKKGLSKRQQKKLARSNTVSLLDTVKLDYEDMEPKENNTVGQTKVLTKLSKRSIIDHVKAKRKDDKKMAHDKTKKSNKFDVVKSVAWLIEAAFRAFVGWILLTNFDRYITTAAALYALGTAAIIVVAHFVKANR